MSVVVGLLAGIGALTVLSGAIWTVGKAIDFKDSTDRRLGDIGLWQDSLEKLWDSHNDLQIQFRVLQKEHQPSAKKGSRS